MGFACKHWFLPPYITTENCTYDIRVYLICTSKVMSFHSLFTWQHLTVLCKIFFGPELLHLKGYVLWTYNFEASNQKLFVGYNHICTLWSLQCLVIPTLPKRDTSRFDKKGSNHLAGKKLGSIGILTRNEKLSLFKIHKDIAFCWQNSLPVDTLVKMDHLWVVTDTSY